MDTNALTGGPNHPGGQDQAGQSAISGSQANSLTQDVFVFSTHNTTIPALGSAVFTSVTITSSLWESVVPQASIFQTWKLNSVEFTLNYAGYNTTTPDSGEASGVESHLTAEKSNQQRLHLRTSNLEHCQVAIGSSFTPTVQTRQETPRHIQSLSVSHRPYRR